MHPNCVPCPSLLANGQGLVRSPRQPKGPRGVSLFSDKIYALRHTRNKLGVEMIPAHKDTIMIHCLATPQSWGNGKSARAAMKEVTTWHVRDNGWQAVAYAAIIAYAGDWAKGRDLDADGDVWEETGAGAKGWNKNVIHLALVGGKGGAADDIFSDHYTLAQDKTLRLLIADIEAQAGRKMKIIGHNQTAAKACPCFNVPDWYAVSPSQIEAHQPSLIENLISAILALFGKAKR